jgi:exosortase/archaeosortase
MLNQDITGTAIQFIAIPWCLWVTVSIFNQRQEVALLRQMLEVMQKPYKHASAD